MSCTFVWKNADTDDDIPPSDQNRVVRAVRISGSGQSAVISATYSRVQADMEAQIHHLEQEAYRAVLRAFKAQSDQLSWVLTFSVGVSFDT